MNARKLTGNLLAAALILTATTAPLRATEQLTALEDKLLAGHTEVTFHLTASGPVEADLKGTLTTSPGNICALKATGTLGDKPVDVALASDGTSLTFTTPRGEQQGKTLPALNESLLLGLTRMGILHNVFRLANNAPPDHATGGVREWVKPADLEAAADTLAFTVLVRDKKSGQATLTIDNGTGLPSRRVQTVTFPGGEMRVTERYSTFTLEPAKP